MLVLLLLFVWEAGAAVVRQEQQLSKPLTALYRPDEPSARSAFKEFQKLGKNENDVNNFKNLSTVRVRGAKHVLVEGDMIAPRVERQIERINSSRPILSKGIKNGLWPDGRIPYSFATSITGYKKDVILQAMEHWSSQTCLTFEKKKKSDEDYVEFYNGGGCFSDLGRYGGKQLISIASRCVRLGIIVHEIGHAIGFYHEQSRPDRDDFVQVKLQNAKPGSSNNFAKYSRDYIDTHGTPYDYGSIMHYRTTAFSANGEPTIIPLDDADQDQMGQRIKLSELDVSLAKSMYNCDVEPEEGPSPPEPTCEDKSSDCLEWADEGLCTNGSFVVFMLKNCHISCGVCAPTQDIRRIQPMLFTAVLAPAQLRVVQVKKKSVSLEILAEEAARIHIMYKEENAVNWGYGLYRSYTPDEPVYTIYNLKRNTSYLVVVRYTREEDKWSEFSEEMRFRTRRTAVPRGRTRTKVEFKEELDIMKLE